MYWSREKKNNILQDITYKMYQYMFSFVVFSTVNLFDAMTYSSWLSQNLHCSMQETKRKTFCNTTYRMYQYMYMFTFVFCSTVNLLRVMAYM